MFNSHSTFIVILGIILTFLLNAQGEKYNYESTEYGSIVQYCQEIGNPCEYNYMNRQPEMIEKYGTSYWNLEHKLKQQKVFVIIPVIILIITLFVSFTLDSNEVVFSILILSPLFTTFLFKFIFGAEFCMTPFYFIYAAGLTSLFSRIKRLYIKNT